MACPSPLYALGLLVVNLLCHEDTDADNDILYNGKLVLGGLLLRATKCPCHWGLVVKRCCKGKFCLLLPDCLLIMTFVPLLIWLTCYMSKKLSRFRACFSQLIAAPNRCCQCDAYGVGSSGCMH